MHGRAALCRATRIVRAYMAQGRARQQRKFSDFPAFTVSHIKSKLLTRFRCRFRLRVRYA